MKLLHSTVYPVLAADCFEPDMLILCRPDLGPFLFDEFYTSHRPGGSVAGPKTVGARLIGMLLSPGCRQPTCHFYTDS